jgi:hypothetical protein
MRWGSVATVALSVTLGSIAMAEEPLDHAPVGTYMKLRDQALTATARSLKMQDEVFGVVMETGYPEAVVTLVSFADGTASLYFSNGGGVVGSGQHAGPAAASQSLVALAARSRQGLSAANNTPLPKVGYTRFYVLTQHGTVTAEAKEEDLGENRHALSPLFYAAQDVITEIRKVEEARQ